MEISQRTVDYLLTHRQPLDEPHLSLLQQLDPHVVSRWVGAYFQAVPDLPLLPVEVDPSGQATLHRMICSALVQVGTHEAVPALEQLARNGDSLRPTYSSPFFMPWVAALVIAKRDPWPGVDDWLAGLVDETEPLVSNADPVPELGATAAGLLIERQEASPYSFELEPAGNDAFDESKFASYHFVSEAGRKAVRQWWEKRKRDIADKSAP